MKRDLWEGGHRVPLIIRWPDVVQASSVSDETIRQVDFAATFATMIGYDLAPKDAIDSYDILPLLKGQAYSQPLRQATVQNTFKDKYAIRQGDWLYVNSQTGTARKDAPEWFKEKKGYGDFQTPGLLFNLKADPAQKKNLFKEHPEKVMSMKALLRRYLEGEACGPHARALSNQVD